MTPVLDPQPNPHSADERPIAADTEANHPDLPLYDGQLPTTLDEANAIMAGVGTTHRGLSDAVNNAIIALQAAILAADMEAMPEQAHHSDQSIEVETAGQTASVEITTPTTKDRHVPEPTGEGIPVPLWENVAMKIYPEARGTYTVEFTKGGVRLCIEVSRSPPWLSTRLQDRLVASLTSTLGDEGRSREFVRRKVIEAFSEIARLLETDDGTKRALTSAAVRAVIERTEKVTIYPADEGGYYEIVISGKILTLTTAQLARKTPYGDGGFNHRWLILFPTDEIDATAGDWKAIKQNWLEIADVLEVEHVTEVEIVIERLREDLETIALVESPEQVVGDSTAWKDPGTGEVWVPARRITRFLNETVNKPGWSSRLSKEVRNDGGMKTVTRTLDMGTPKRKTRCWVFVPGFAVFRDCREGNGTVAEYLEAGEEGNR